MFRILAAAALFLFLAAVARASDVSTSFEFTDSSGSFTLGTAPNTATFQGGIAGSIGIPGMYTSGLNSWMVLAGGTGTIAFGVPAQSVTLFFRDQFAGNASVLAALDAGGQVLATLGGTIQFQQVTFTAAALGAPIAGLRLDSNGSVGRTAVDDFMYCAQPGGPITDPIPGTIPQSSVAIRLVPVAEGLVAPNWGTAAPVLPAASPALADFLFVTDQDGVLWAINVASGQKVVFLDVASQLVSLGIAGPGTFDERGLLGVAFHPAYASNGLLYTYTSEPASGPADFSTLSPGETANHQAVVTEWRVAQPGAAPDAADPTTLVDPNSERELLRIDEPQFNHDGGCLNFGGDGMLYVSLGDGGAADDQGTGHVPGGNGQDPGNVLGTILRIDPTGTNSANGRYGIPLDNPFVADPGIPDEIHSYGFRNPFRFSFDLGTPANPGTGDLIVADVGQNDIEEIDVVQAGANLGWPCKEGTFFFDMNGAGDGFVTLVPPHQVPPGLIDPIAQYDHDEGSAVIGGFVYRGSRLPQLSGLYVFGDFARTFSADGRLFHLDQNGDVVEFQIAGQAALGLALFGFGQDAGGEIYVLGNLTGVPFPDPSGARTGVVLRVEPASGFIDLGFGKPGGTGVVPHLSGSGPLVAGSSNGISLSSAAANSAAVLLVGTTEVRLPFRGGTLIPSPDVLFVGLPTDVLGELSRSFVWPASAPAGAAAVLQFWVSDPSASFSLSASNGLLLVGN